VNNTSSVSWLKSYRAQYGITFPLIFDQQSPLFNLYQVGGSFGNTPPTYVIIDTAGVVRYRFDAKFNRFEEIKSDIQGLL
jgi:peroxiredoxin